ncbi:serine hydrolase domain-containing protein [Dictyobacter aurantiacus]|uniref:FmtA-like protein n=1 Tax=Dictyobacter aurantiacus TaxID=1936993 RepID=A0A401Z7C8_9CHLR|nr:serine hydrolase domain-containing protein [Dictyobacter aurantiacus]GCE02767.1 FmtA-like protein [Dictyobacter aurantiacus]
MRPFKSLPTHRKIFARPRGRSILAVFLLSCLLLFAVVLTPLKLVQADSASEPAGNLSDGHDLQTFLDHTFSAQMQAYHIPGATVSVVKDGRVLSARGYGKANLQRGTPVSASTTLFHIASVSKLFTWTAVMQLAEQGKLNLHTDVNRYLKTFQIPATYPQPITLAHLLTHTAGFEESAPSDSTNAADLEPLGRWLAANIPARVRPPGEIASYSNYGATLAGYIVQQTSGLPFERYIEEHIYQLLGMNHSTFHQPIPTPLSADQAQGYTYRGTSYEATPFPYMQDTPAGSMASTATDMARFMLAHLQDGRLGTARILQLATAQEMHRRQFTNDPRIPGITYGFFEQDVNNQRVIMHSGDDPSFHSLLLLLPVQRVGLFVAYNSDGGSEARGKLWHAFLDRYFPAPSRHMSMPKPLPEFAQRVKQITGSYWPTRRNDTTFWKVPTLFETINVQDEGNGRIRVQRMFQGSPAGQTAVEVQPWLFRQVNGQGLFAFQVGQNGTIMLQNNALDAYTKLGWYETPLFHLILVSCTLLLFLSAFLLLLWLLLQMFRFRRMGAPQVKSTSSRIARWIMGLVSGVNVMILLLLAVLLRFVVIFNFQGITFFTRSGHILLFALALASVILTVGTVVCAALVWKQRIWGRGLRLHYTLVTLAALVFVWEVAYWNLLRW